MIGKADVEKLANLARLRVTDEEASNLAKDIDSILSYVSQLPEAEAAKGEEKMPLRNVMREDGVPHETGMHTETLLKAAPRSEGGHVVVKKILNKD